MKKQLNSIKVPKTRMFTKAKQHAFLHKQNHKNKAWPTSKCKKLRSSGSAVFHIHRRKHLY